MYSSSMGWVKVAAPLSDATERIGGNSLQPTSCQRDPVPLLFLRPFLPVHLFIRTCIIPSDLLQSSNTRHTAQTRVHPLTHQLFPPRASCGPSRSGSPSPSYVPESFSPRRSTRLRLRHNQKMSAPSRPSNRNCLRPDRVVGCAICGRGSDYGRVSVIRTKGRRCRACQSRLVARGRVGSRDG
jgi:DNA-directed RNA polymerase subunit RPC12/RpoP